MIDPKSKTSKSAPPLSKESLGDAIDLMYFAYRGFTSHADKILERRGLNRVHHRVLYFIGRDPDLTVGELIQTLAVSKQALNAPLRQLMEMKLVSQSVDTEDRRMKRLDLTRRGRKLEAKLSKTQTSQLKRAFHGLDTEQVEAWYQVMDALSETAREM